MNRKAVDCMAITINSVLEMESFNDVTLENLEDPYEGCRRGTAA